MIDIRILPQGMIHKPFPMRLDDSPQNIRGKNSLSTDFPGQTFPRSNALSSGRRDKFKRYQEESRMPTSAGFGLDSQNSLNPEKIGQIGRNELLQRFGAELHSLADKLEEPTASGSARIPSGPEKSSQEFPLSQGIGGVATVASASSGGALPFAGAIYSAYNLVSNFGRSDLATGAINGTALGAYLGSVVPGVGTLLGGMLGGVLGAASSFVLQSGKDKDQIQRDALRSKLQDLGLIDQNYQIELANGDRFDLGKDGGFTLENLDGSRRHNYETDPSNPLSSLAIGLLNPIAFLLTGGEPKAQSDLVGLLANAATRNAKTAEEVRKNVLGFLQKLDIREEQLLNALKSSTHSKSLRSAEFSAYTNGVRTIFDSKLLEQQSEQSEQSE